MCSFLERCLYFTLSVWCLNTAVINGSHNCRTGKDYDCNGLTICYWLVSSYNDADTADLECQGEGGYLAFIPNQDAMNIVKHLTDSSTFYYIGYEAVSGAIQIRNTDRVQHWTDWDSNEPNGGSESCIMIRDGKLHDQVCSTSHLAVCSIYVPGRSATEYPQCTEPDITTTEATTTVAATTTVETTILETTKQPTTTTEYTTTKSATTTEALSTTSDPCECTCTYINTTINIQEMTEQIKKEMTVDKTTLSSHIRKLNSAEDSRESSARIGYVGVMIITLVLGCVLLIDISKIFQICNRN